MDAVILVTRLNAQPFALNPDHIERIEANPDTVVTLVDGTKYIVAEPVHEVISRVVAYRARVLAEAQRWESRTEGDPPGGSLEARVLPLPVREL
jgi:flagellar protein FlbD